MRRGQLGAIAVAMMIGAGCSPAPSPPAPADRPVEPRSSPSPPETGPADWFTYRCAWGPTPVGPDGRRVVADEVELTSAVLATHMRHYDAGPRSSRMISEADSDALRRLAAELTPADLGGDAPAPTADGTDCTLTLHFGERAAAFAVTRPAAELPARLRPLVEALDRHRRAPTPAWYRVADDVVAHCLELAPDPDRTWTLEEVRAAPVDDSPGILYFTTEADDSADHFGCRPRGTNLPRILPEG